ncbi:hypothetical protein AKO1_010318 [Acrasis kona]|uniref:RRM domain-containing protein n=1 Tax=Acrasis kona TaxID=1008807 RepID=A0AAW2ZSG1_9EUKA
MRSMMRSRPTDQDNKHFTNIFVRNLPLNISYDRFKEFFERFGRIKDCKLLFHPRTKQFEGDALVLFLNPQSAHLAVRRECFVESKKVRIAFADRQPEKRLLIRERSLSPSEEQPRKRTKYFESRSSLTLEYTTSTSRQAEVIQERERSPIDFDSISN